MKVFGQCEDWYQRQGTVGEEMYDRATYGGVRRRSSTPHKSWSKMKRKTKNCLWAYGDRGKGNSRFADDADLIREST